MGSIYPLSYLIALPLVILHATFSRHGFRDTMGEDFERFFSFWRLRT